MINKIEKPKLTSAQLIQKAKDDRGITFNYISEQDAEAYIQLKNNYLRTAAYRKNYQKYLNGTNKNKYINLDFAYLVELSTIDMHLRMLISKMCFDIEHAMKVKLIEDIENDVNEDGYSIVEQFLNANTYIVKGLGRKSISPFTGDLINKYFNVSQVVNKTNHRMENIIVGFDCPAWVLVELLSFGEFIRFYEFYYSRASRKHIAPSIIHLVRSLRNGCAHNNCIISDLSHTTSHPPKEISQAVAKLRCISKTQRIKKLSTRPILEFTCMLYMYGAVVSEKVKEHRVNELKKLFYGRMQQKKGYFTKNELIKSSFEFALKLVEHMVK